MAGLNKIVEKVSDIAWGVTLGFFALQVICFGPSGDLPLLVNAMAIFGCDFRSHMRLFFIAAFILVLASLVYRYILHVRVSGSIKPRGTFKATDDNPYIVGLSHVIKILFSIGGYMYLSMGWNECTN